MSERVEYLGPFQMWEDYMPDSKRECPHCHCTENPGDVHHPTRREGICWVDKPKAAAPSSLGTEKK